MDEIDNKKIDSVMKQCSDMQIKIEKIYISVEKTRRYFLWTLIISVAVIILPLIGLLFALPKYLDMLGSSLGGL